MEIKQEFASKYPTALGGPITVAGSLGMIQEYFGSWAHKLLICLPCGHSLEELNKMSVNMLVNKFIGTKGMVYLPTWMVAVHVHV